MPGFIKNAADERMWEVAKDRARAAATKGGVYNVWGLANSIFHKMKSGEMIKEEAITPELENGNGLINNILEDECYRDIKHYVSNHPVYGELPEEELYGHVENCYEDYLKSNKDLSTGVIYEFVNQYFNGGATSSAYVAGGGVVGGYRAEKPIGPIVYGMPNNGVEPVNPDKVDPAVVVIPPKQSNYKPWETELDASGNAVNDLERNKVISDDKEKEKVWGDVSHDVAFELEKAGVDLDDLEHMTQEEIEDKLLQVVKQQLAQSNQAGAKNAVSQLSETQLKIEEAFSWELDEDRVDGKTRRAREILAKKHQIKRALERDEHKRYVMDKRTIEKTMYKFGYMFDKSGWAKRQPKVSKFKAVAFTPSPEPEVDGTPDATPSTVPQKAAPVVNEPTAVQQVKPKEKEDGRDEDEDDNGDPNPLHDPLLRGEMKTLQARFILAMGHDVKDASDFVANPQTGEDVPKISDQDILSKLELLGYTWNSDKLAWTNESMTLPNQIFAKKEGPKSIWARSYLAARGKLRNIKVNNSGDAAVPVEEILEDMADDDFVFNSETHSWKWVEPKEELKESAQHEVPNFINVEDQEVIDEAQKKDKPIDLGYDPKAAAYFQARFLLRAEYLEQFATWLNKKKRTALAIEHAWAKVQDPRNNPVNFNKDKITDPTMQDHHVAKDLENLGYKDVRQNDVIMWSKNGSIPPYIGEEATDVLARAIIAVTEKNIHAISFDEAAGKSGKLAPTIKIDRIKKEMEHSNFVQDKKYGWAKSDKDNASPASREYALEMMRIIKRFEHADWESMTAEQQKQFERALAYPKMISFFGMEENDFPVEDTPEDQAKREDLFRKFKKKWKFEQKDGVKVWTRRNKPVDQELHSNKFMAAASKVAGILKRTVKGSEFAATGLLKGLMKLNTIFNPNAKVHDLHQMANNAGGAAKNVANGLAGNEPNKRG